MNEKELDSFISSLGAKENRIIIDKKLGEILEDYYQNRYLGITEKEEDAFIRKIKTIVRESLPEKKKCDCEMCELGFTSECDDRIKPHNEAIREIEKVWGE